MKYVLVALAPSREHIIIGPRGGRYILRNKRKIYIKDDNKIDDVIDKFNNLSDEQRRKIFSDLQESVEEDVVDHINNMSAEDQRKLFENALRASRDIPDDVADNGGPNLDDVPPESRNKLLNSLTRFWRKIRPMDGEPDEEELNRPRRQFSKPRVFVKFGLAALGAISYIFAGDTKLTETATEYSEYKDKNATNDKKSHKKKKGSTYKGPPRNNNSSNNSSNSNNSSDNSSDDNPSDSNNSSGNNNSNNQGNI